MFFRIVQTAGASVGLKISSAAMTFMTTIVIARELSASGVGIFALAGVAATIGAIVVSAGFDALALKIGARDSRKRTERRLERILTSFIIISPVSTAIATLIIAVLLNRLGLDVRSLLAPVIVQTAAMGAYRVVGASLQAHGGVVLSQIGELTIRPVAMFSAIYFIASHGDLTEERLLWCMAFGACACLVYSVLLYLLQNQRTVKSAMPRGQGHVVAGLALRGSSYAGFFAIVLLIEQIDILMLGMLRDQAEAGLYQPASRIAWLASLGSTAISIICRPQFARAVAGRDITRVWRMLNTYRAVSVIYTVIASLLIMNFSSEVFSLFGEEYEGANSIVGILLILHGIASFIGPVDAAAQVMGEGNTILVLSLFALGVFLAAGFILIPPFGAHGAAIGAVIGGVTYRMSFFFYVRRHLNTFAAQLRMA